MVDAVSLEVFHHLFASVAEEMGVTLGRTAYSPNIKERRDFSCAVFDAAGRLVAHAAHIPVHLGAMPASVAAALERFDLAPGDMAMLNDPYLGGTHLPDVTLVSPVYVPGEGGEGERLAGYVSSRAHHADVGGMAPGSMPLSTELYQEGLILPPLKVMVGGEPVQQVLDIFYRNSRTPEERRGDLAAQLAAHRVGEGRLREIVARYGLAQVREHVEALFDYTERMTRQALRAIPEGAYVFQDRMEDLTADGSPAIIRAAVTLRDSALTVDFTGTSPEVESNSNAVLAVTQSAVLYVLRCLTGEEVPANHGSLLPLRIVAPEGSLVNPRPPRAVAAGNVETSSRIVDVVLGALAQALPGRIPAASQGSMNNLTLGGWDPRRQAPFAYYETIGGGVGGGPEGPGASAVHSHMTNTMNTPVEALELQLPVRVREYGIRRGSGGAGHHPGGDGIRRSLELLAPATVTLLTERRTHAPYGLQGGGTGTPGRNLLLRPKAPPQELPARCTFQAQPGDVLVIETPGGGGWGRAVGGGGRVIDP